LTSNEVLIRDYIQSQSEVKYVLLAADANSSFSLPTWYVSDPLIGTFATDAPYGDRDGDGLADIAIGRWPVHDSHEVARCARKSIGYDLQSPAQTFRHRWTGFTFDLPGGFVDLTMTRAAGDAFHGLAPATSVQYVASEIPCCYEERKTVFIDAVNAGAHVLWAVGALADKHSICRFFDNDEIIYQCPWPPDARSYWSFSLDLSRFHQNRAYGFWFPLSCHTGGFDIEDLYDCQYDWWVRPLAEEFLLAPDFGPVTWFGPTRASYQEENDQIGREVLSRLTQATTQSVGQACVAATKALAIAKPVARVRAASYAFLGDPTIIMAWDDVPTEVTAGTVTSTVGLLIGPNPGTSSFSLQFAIPRPAVVSLAVFDVAGRQVRSLARGQFQAGSHSGTWDGRNEQGHPAASGIYLLQLRTIDRVLTQKIVLVREN